MREKYLKDPVWRLQRALNLARVWEDNGRIDLESVTENQLWILEGRTLNYLEQDAKYAPESWCCALVNFLTWINSTDAV